MKTFTLNILFVCTGNTCRSPMAEAIAVGLAARDEKAAPSAAASPKGKGVEVKLRIRSAGVGASSGSPQTPEGAKAVRMLGFEGPKGGGGSRPLTREMIAEADLIYGMTRSHVAGVLAIDPSAKGKAMLLDPDGGEVADPIGLSQDAYNQVAGRLEAMIARRLKEWRP